MRILVTGSDGVIGTYLTQTLSKHFNLYGIDNCKKYGYRRVRPYRFTLLDTKDGINLDKYFEKIEPNIVIDLAADVGGVCYMNDGSLQMLDNISGNINVINSSIKYGAYYIYASSSVVDSEDDSYYTNYKKTIEQVLENTKYDKITILRLYNIVGKYEDCDIKQQHIIPTLIKKIHKSNHIELFGTGREQRCFTHGLDCANAILNIMNKNERDREYIYNIINTNNIISLEQLAIQINTIINKNELQINYIDNPYSSVTYDVFPESNLDFKYGIDMNHILQESCNYYV